MLKNMVTANQYGGSAVASLMGPVVQHMDHMLSDATLTEKALRSSPFQQLYNH